METKVPYDTDEALMKALHLGQADAYEQLVRVHANRLLRLAFHRLSSRADAEDLVQDLFVELWEKRQQLRIASSIEGYLNTALKNRVLRHIARLDLHQKATENLLLQMDSMQASILDILAAKDLQTTLSEAVKSLPQNMQKIFVLRGEDYTLKEIAQALGLSEQTVKNYSSELARRLRTAIAEKHPDISHSLLAVITYLLTKS